ncbi:MAG: Thymidylate kinase (EC [uncultured Sulfurovum sp.]|uniref:Thymidylate kinase (EC) n=1 Tax=uncultured Sulfurovum sp. TaxID=269237 RepID=A0A6S6SQE2_9BACT|nr:MAG: Thymidylate kinase (EC [uncultured Sulfurovum sp.]
MLKKLIILGLLLMNTQANELKNEESPYLLQHANNPVNWLPWGDEALAKAKQENKIIFLSIGYSTCHWCHVMGHESFENEEIAEILNRDFINIKVDREEYPNIDKHYQDVYKVMNQRAGGWPLTVIMTPDAKVFYTATYLPPKAKSKYRGLDEILPDMYDLYHNRKELVTTMTYNIERITKKKSTLEENASMPIDENLSMLFLTQLTEKYDARYKGIGVEPKFPHATSFDTLLDISRLTLNFDAKTMADDALTAMAKGGINDQIEGGFYRYSTDEEWRTPHFEKMLYTNAELLETYDNAYKMSGNELFKETMNKTIENIYARFEKENLFYSASDADSNGVEGKYFTYTYRETLKVLEQKGISNAEAQIAVNYFNITEEGNFEDETSNPFLSDEIEPKNIVKIKEILLELRKERDYPFIDYKVQTSWNALFIKGLFKAGEKEKALKSLDALVKNLYLKDELYHQRILGTEPKVKGYLEDYAFLIAALIEAYQATFDEKHLNLAKKLNAQSIQKFYKEKQWHLSDDNFKSIADLDDMPYRSAMAVSIENILLLAHLSDDYDAYDLAKNMLTLHARKINLESSETPYATKIALMLQNGVVIIKANKENLLTHQKEIDELYYPYVLRKTVKEDDFSACTMQKCFSTDTKIDKILGDIESKQF